MTPAPSDWSPVEKTLEGKCERGKDSQLPSVALKGSGGKAVCLMMLNNNISEKKKEKKKGNMCSPVGWHFSLKAFFC